MAEIQETAPSADSAIHDWPMRPWILAAGLGLAGLLVHLFSHNGENDPARMAATAFVFFGAIALALGSIAPPAALLATLELGPGEDSDCGGQYAK